MVNDLIIDHNVKYVDEGFIWDTKYDYGYKGVPLEVRQAVVDDLLAGDPGRVLTGQQIFDYWVKLGKPEDMDDFDEALR